VPGHHALKVYAGSGCKTQHTFDLATNAGESSASYSGRFDPVEIACDTYRRLKRLRLSVRGGEKKNPQSPSDRRSVPELDLPFPEHETRILMRRLQLNKLQ
jgi:hypothetical protein